MESPRTLTDFGLSAAGSNRWVGSGVKNKACWTRFGLVSSPIDVDDSAVAPSCAWARVGEVLAAGIHHVLSTPPHESAAAAWSSRRLEAGVGGAVRWGKVRLTWRWHGYALVGYAEGYRRQAVGKGNSVNAPGVSGCAVENC